MPRSARFRCRNSWQLQVLEDRTQPSVVFAPPTANDDFADTDGNNPVTVNILENDGSVGGRTLVPGSVQFVGIPHNGLISLNKLDGSVTYTSIGFFQGTDTFKYTVRDSAGAVSNAATVTIVVNRPIANDDFAETTGNNPFYIDVLANDTDPDGNDEINKPLTSIVSPPSHGKAEFQFFVIDPGPGNPQGGIFAQVQYTPTSNFKGTDTFKYTITDFAGATSKPGTVTVVVNQPATVVVPTALDDVADTDGANPVTVDILANDQTGPGLSLDPATVTLASAPQRGIVTFDKTTGEATYIATGFFQGTDNFQYTVKDSLGVTSNKATVTIVVNRPIANDDFADTDGNNPVEIDVLENDTDPDGNAEIVPGSVTIVTPPAHGDAVVDSGTGLVTYTAIGFFQGSDTFQYTITDKAGAESAPGTVTVVVNRPHANDDAAATTGTNPVSLDLLENDTDPDGVAELNPDSVAITSQPAHGTLSIAGTSGLVTYTPNAAFIGTDVFTYTVTDFPGAVSNEGTVRIRVDSPAASQLTAAGADAGGGPRVVAFNADGSVRGTFFAYAENFLGGVRVAVGDVNGDGVPDIVTAAGSSGGPHIKVFDGLTLQPISGFFAYDGAFRGGVNIAVADINGDGHADIVTGAGAGGGPHVKAFSGADGSLIRSFFAYDGAFRGGVSVAAGDVDGDGHADILTAPGARSAPHVKVFSGTDNSLLRSFFAYDGTFFGGATVAAGDFNGDGRADIVTGPGPGGGPHVKVFDGADLTLIRSFFAYTPSFTGGLHVAAGDVNGDGHADLIVGPGNGQSLPTQLYDGISFDLISSDNPFGSFRGGVFVGGPG